MALLISVLVVGTVTAAWYFWKRAGQIAHFAAPSRVIIAGKVQVSVGTLRINFHDFLILLKVERADMFFRTFFGF